MDRSWNFLANSNYLFNIEIIALVPYGSTRMFVAEISRKNERERERENEGFKVIYASICIFYQIIVGVIVTIYIDVTLVRR